MDVARAWLLRLGYPAVFLGPALENAGLPVPGDSVLFWTAFLAAEGHFRLELLMALAASGAVLGDNAGYWIGRRSGRPLLLRWAARRPAMARALARTEAVLARHGGGMVFVARFVPGLRVVAALVAGAGLMPWRRFLWCNVAGAVAWAAVTGAMGYGLGRQAAWTGSVTGRPWLAALGAGVAFAALLWLQARLARRLDRAGAPGPR